MLDLFAGRLDRKSYIIGNAVALGVLLAAIMIIIFPIAIVDLVINSNRDSDLFDVLYLVLIVPGVMWYFFFMILMVRRLHDLGYPGLLAVIVFSLTEAAGRYLDLWVINLLGLLFIAFLCLAPGQKMRNQFGNKPSRRFNLATIKPHV